MKTHTARRWLQVFPLALMLAACGSRDNQVYHDPQGIDLPCPPRYHAEVAARPAGQQVSPEQWDQAREKCLREQSAKASKAQ
jgi:hypothetical protein